MAKITTHTLNGVDGSHAGHVAISLHVIPADSSRREIFSGATDAGGRFMRVLDPGEVDPAATYELVFATADYWARHPAPRTGAQIMHEVVLRFQMPEPDARYHLPVILSPNGYSVWWSVPEEN
jgi:5-hydroxyisourate hydrolase